MVHKLSCYLAEWFYQHEWIEESNYAWCIYVVEKKLLQICYLLILSVCFIVSKQYLNAFVFMATLYILRCRIGGWHAPYNWLCILLTTIIVLTAIYVLAPAFMNANDVFIWFLDILLVMVAFLMDPVYPPQLHFNQEIVSANRRKKNLILMYIALMQIVSFGFGVEQILIFSFNGILVSVLLVFIEKFKQKYGGQSYAPPGIPWEEDSVRYHHH